MYAHVKNIDPIGQHQQPKLSITASITNIYEKRSYSENSLNFKVNTVEDNVEINIFFPAA